MIDSLEKFAPCLGQPFTIVDDAGNEFPVTLVEATARPVVEYPGRTKDPFQIQFKSADHSARASLPQRVYTVTHEILGPMGIFLVPIGPPRDGGGFLYQAIYVSANRTASGTRPVSLQRSGLPAIIGCPQLDRSSAGLVETRQSEQKRASPFRQVQSGPQFAARRERRVLRMRRVPRQSTRRRQLPGGAASSVRRSPVAGKLPMGPAFWLPSPQPSLPMRRSLSALPQSQIPRAPRSGT